jgi:hypothetical protein
MCLLLDEKVVVAQYLPLTFRMIEIYDGQTIVAHLVEYVVLHLINDGKLQEADKLLCNDK